MGLNKATMHYIENVPLEYADTVIDVLKWVHINSMYNKKGILFSIHTSRELRYVLDFCERVGLKTGIPPIEYR